MSISLVLKLGIKKDSKGKLLVAGCEVGTSDAFALPFRGWWAIAFIVETRTVNPNP